jgi:hypothetical protein
MLRWIRLPLLLTTKARYYKVMKNLSLSLIGASFFLFCFLAIPEPARATSRDVVFVCTSDTATATEAPKEKKGFFSFLFKKSEPTKVYIDCSKSKPVSTITASTTAKQSDTKETGGFSAFLKRLFSPPKFPSFAPTPSPGTTRPSYPDTPEGQRAQEEATKQKIAQDVANAQQQAKKIETDIAYLKAHENDSPLRGLLHLSVQPSWNDSSAGEYVTISADYSLPADKRITITGLRLKNAKGVSVTVPEGIGLPLPGQSIITEPVILRAGQSATIATGPSANGLSFRLNKCTGYFAQTRSFTPGISQSCPHPRQEPWIVSMEPECRDYLNTIGSCSVPTKLPLGLSSECQSIVATKLNYSGCVADHQRDTDFLGNEWRLYLNRSQRLWQNRYETVTLLDTNNKIIDIYTNNYY